MTRLWPHWLLKVTVVVTVAPTFPCRAPACWFLSKPGSHCPSSAWPGQGQVRHHLTPYDSNSTSQCMLQQSQSQSAQPRAVLNWQFMAMQRALCTQAVAPLPRMSCTRHVETSGIRVKPRSCSSWTLSSLSLFTSALCHLFSLAYWFIEIYWLSSSKYSSNRRSSAWEMTSHPVETQTWVDFAALPPATLNLRSMTAMRQFAQSFEALYKTRPSKFLFLILQSTSTVDFRRPPTAVR